MARRQKAQLWPLIKTRACVRARFQLKSETTSEKENKSFAVVVTVVVGFNFVVVVVVVSVGPKRRPTKTQVLGQLKH